MKAEVTINELRVGNLVHLIANGHENEPDLVKWIVDDFEFYENRMKDIQPIPLTEEWLLRLGFHKEHNIDKSEDRDCFYINDCDDSFYINYDKNSYDGWYLGATTYGYLTSLNYLHQLQNLYFALTNEELTIKSK